MRVILSEQSLPRETAASGLTAVGREHKRRKATWRVVDWIEAQSAVVRDDVGRSFHRQAHDGGINNVGGPRLAKQCTRCMSAAFSYFRATCFTGTSRWLTMSTAAWDCLRMM
jgi:hypothetical protein